MKGKDRTFALHTHEEAPVLDLSKLTPKKLLGDPAFYAAALPLLSYFDPALARFLDSHGDLVQLYGSAILGHFGVRLVAAHGKAKAIAAAPDALTASQATNPPNDMPADSAIDPTTIGVADHETEETFGA